eukprot:4814328-Pleurochrysis_carterae.AAC.3
MPARPQHKGCGKVAELPVNYGAAKEPSQSMERCKRARWPNSKTLPKMQHSTNKGVQAYLEGTRNLITAWERFQSGALRCRSACAL